MFIIKLLFWVVNLWKKVDSQLVHYLFMNYNEYTWPMGCQLHKFYQRDKSTGHIRKLTMHGTLPLVACRCTCDKTICSSVRITCSSRVLKRCTNATMISRQYAAKHVAQNTTFVSKIMIRLTRKYEKQTLAMNVVCQVILCPFSYIWIWHQKLNWTPSLYFNNTTNVSGYQEMIASLRSACQHYYTLPLPI